jgi:hypothetical protein
MSNNKLIKNDLLEKNYIQIRNLKQIMTAQSEAYEK